MSLLGGAAGLLTGNVGLYAVAAAVAIGVGAWGYERVQRSDSDAMLATERATWANREAELSERALAAEQREREKEQLWNARQQEVISNATQKLAAADSAASAAVSSRDRLLERLQAIASAGRRARQNPAPASGGASAPDAIGVLADVLGRADAAAGFMAAVADQRGLRGEACERAYESLRK